MTLIIVPDYVSEAIDKEIDGFLAKNPQMADQRENMKQDLINAFDEHGVVASLSPKTDVSGA